MRQILLIYKVNLFERLRPETNRFHAKLLHAFDCLAEDSDETEEDEEEDR